MSVRNKPVIGLTGSIAAGKSTVAGMFRDLGACIIDSDRVSHEVLQTDEVKAILTGWWGGAILDESGRVDRKAVATRVFGQSEALARLEGVLYPRIGERRRDVLAAAQADPGYSAVVIDAPKLIEAGLHESCDAVVVVDAAIALRCARAAVRGWSAEELQRRENMLEPLDKKVDIADYVIVNNDGIAELQRQVASVFTAVLEGFTQKHS